MTPNVDTSYDIDYDYEDFGLEQEELEDKYEAHGHPTYTVADWLADPIKDDFNGYWDWVMYLISRDEATM